MNFLQILINIIGARFIRITNRLTRLLSPAFVITHITVLFRRFVEKVLDVRPRNKDDYYPIARWLVSKRLAYAVVILVGIICALFIFVSRSALFPGSANSHIKTYKYNSLLLKFAKGKVRIKAKSGYVAFEGDVSKGRCNGDGTLKNRDGVVVYEGKFSDNKYEGVGKEYYNNGTLKYSGDFHENKYNGNGVLYRESGTLAYEGGFSQSMRDGDGIMYDAGGDPIFEGSFSMNKIQYGSLIGKSAEEMAKCYTGKRKLYRANGEQVRVCEDIGAMTEEVTPEDSIDEGATVSGVYVLDNKIRLGSRYFRTFLSLAEALGDPSYVGESYATLPEVLIINRMNDASDVDVLGGTVQITTSEVFNEYVEVEKYDEAYPVYLHSYEKDGLVYNFVSEQGDDSFAFYYILKSTEGSESNEEES